jgi:xanthine dehydrogenase accessory factor
VLVSDTLPAIERSVVVDARLAKYNLDTRIHDAALVVALGPGFTVGTDCHAIVETARGPHLGRVLRTGSALPNTGIPGEIGGRGAERVLRTPIGGITRWRVQIGDVVRRGDEVGRVGGAVISAPFDGVVRGLIAGGTPVWIGMKIGDIDPRLDTRCDEISDKALAIGGGVLEAVMSWVSATS